MIAAARTRPGTDSERAARRGRRAGGRFTMEAAHRAGAGRVSHTSGVHAVGFHPRSRTIGTEVTVLPDSRYGVGKSFGESSRAGARDARNSRIAGQ